MCGRQSGETLVLPAVFPQRAQGLGTGDHGPPQKQRLLRHKDAPGPRGRGCLDQSRSSEAEKFGVGQVGQVSNMDTHLDRVHQAPSLRRIEGDLAQSCPPASLRNTRSSGVIGPHPYLTCWAAALRVVWTWKNHGRTLSNPSFCGPSQGRECAVMLALQ